MLRRLAIDNAFLLLQYLAASLIPLILIPHLIRQVGLSNYGSLAIAMAWANYGAVVINYAFGLRGPSRIAQPVAGETTGVIVGQIVSGKGLLLAGILLLTGGVLGILSLAEKPVSGPQIWVLLTIPLAAALHAGWYLQAVGRFFEISFSSIIAVAAALAIGFGLPGESPGERIILATLALTASPLLVGFSTFFLTARHLSGQDGPLRWVWPWAELRDGWPLFVSQMMATLYAASGPIFVGFLVGHQDAGAYSVIERVANATVGACLLIHTAAYPKLARMFHADRHAYWHLLKMVVVIYLCMASLMVIGTILIWEQVLHWLLGQSGRSYDLLLAGALVWIFLGVFGPAVTGYLTISGHGNRVFSLTCGVLVVSLFLGVPGLLLYGAWAWLAALCLAQTVVMFTFWRIVRKNSTGEVEA